MCCLFAISELPKTWKTEADDSSRARDVVEAIEDSE